MSRTKRNLKHARWFRKLKTSPHQVNKQVVEKKGDKFSLYAWDDFKISALNETLRIRSVNETDGSMSYYFHDLFLVNLTVQEQIDFDWAYYFPNFAH